MRIRMITTVTLILMLTCITAQAAELEKVYGKGVSATDTVLVSELLAQPDAHVGEVVRVEGTAVAVCKHRGCWVEIASDKEGETVRVKVKDGVIVFPAEIIGEHVIAEGVFTANKLDLETSKKYCAYQAEQAGKEIDPKSVTECVTLYQITGTGVVIKDRPSEETQQSDT